MLYKAFYAEQKYGNITAKLHEDAEKFKKQQNW